MQFDENAEAPPPTQTTIGSSSTNSPRTSRTSFTSFGSLPEESEVKLGKRRATDDDTSHLPLPQWKYVKVNEGDTAR